MIRVKINMESTQDYYSLIPIAECMRLKLKMFMKILAKIKKCLILVIIQNIKMIQTN